MVQIFTYFWAVVAIICSSIAWGAQPADTLSGSKTTSLGYVEDNSSASVTLLAGATNKTSSLYRFILSVSTADTVYLKCGTTQKTAKIYLGANSGLDSNLFPFYLRCNPGEALSLVKGSASTPVGVTLWYNQEP